MHILFICTGNTCRSPMAAFLAKSMISARQLNWQVSSAGLHAISGDKMTSPAVNAMIRRHVVVEQHQAQPVTEALVKSADVVFTMTDAHRFALVERFPSCEDKIHNLARFASFDHPHSEGAYDIVDPFGGSDETYEACATALERMIEQVLDKLERGLR